jgi:hypothetical protein
VSPDYSQEIFLPVLPPFHTPLRWGVEWASGGLSGFLTQKMQDLRSYCDHCHKFIVIASAAKQSRSTQNTDCNGLLRRLRRLAMTTCLAHFVMKITQVRKS